MATRNPREILEELNEGVKDLYVGNREIMKGYGAFTGAVFQDGAISLKNKELIAIALGAYNRCEYCIVSHTYKAMKAGATDEEIMEAAFVATTFGGGASVGYTSTLVSQCVKEFRQDFE